MNAKCKTYIYSALAFAAYRKRTKKMEKRTDFNIGDQVFVWKDNKAVMRIIEDIIITPCLDIKKGAKWPCTNFVLQGEKKLCGANILIIPLLFFVSTLLQ